MDEIKDQCSKAADDYIRSLPYYRVEDHYSDEQVARADFEAGYVAGVARIREDITSGT